MNSQLQQQAEAAAQKEYPTPAGADEYGLLALDVEKRDPFINGFLAHAALQSKEQEAQLQEDMDDDYAHELAEKYTKKYAGENLMSTDAREAIKEALEEAFPVFYQQGTSSKEKQEAHQQVGDVNPLAMVVSILYDELAVVKEPYSAPDNSDIVNIRHIEVAAERIVAALSALQQQPAAQDGRQLWEGLHPDSANLITGFMQALAEKMVRNQQKYGYGNEWMGPDWEAECRENMMNHISKGDPKDVAIYAAFMWHHGWSTARPVSSPSQETAEQPKSAGQWVNASERVPIHGRCVYILDNVGIRRLGVFGWSEGLVDGDMPDELSIEGSDVHKGFDVLKEHFSHYKWLDESA